MNWKYFSCYILFFKLPVIFFLKTINKAAKLGLRYHINYIMMACSILFLFFFPASSGSKGKLFSINTCSKKSPTLHVSTVSWMQYNGGQWNAFPCHSYNELESVTLLKSKPDIVSSQVTLWELQFRHNARAIRAKWKRSALLLCRIKEPFCYHFGNNRQPSNGHSLYKEAIHRPLRSHSNKGTHGGHGCIISLASIVLFLSKAS